MATESNTQTNGFVTGIDCDSSLDRVKDTSYIEAKNLRVMAYDNGSQQGSIKPINGIRVALKDQLEYIDRILSTGSIRNIGVLIYIRNESNQPWFCIATFTNAIGNNTDTDDTFNNISDFKEILKSPLIDWPADEENWPKQISTTYRYEDEDNIKLYIATGFNPILVVNLCKNYGETTIDNISSYPKFLAKKPEFVKYIAGLLKPAQVCYSYQLYSNHGVATDISPACGMIPVLNLPTDVDLIGIDGKLNSVKGVSYGKESSCGVQIRIDTSDTIDIMDHIKVYRVTIQQNGQMPTVEIIYDSTFKPGETFYLNDTGQDALQEISVEEYNSVAGVKIIPEVIENKDNMLFAANLTEKQTFLDTDKFKEWDARAFRATSDGKIIFDYTDKDGYEEFSWNDLETISKSTDKVCREAYNAYNDINYQYNIIDKCVFDNEGYYGGHGVNVDWRFILTYVVMDTCFTQNTLEIGTRWNAIKHDNIDETPSVYFIKNDGLEKTDMTISDEAGKVKYPWLTKSLRRNELYRYGIILYDKYGTASPVKWIADIRTPNLYDQYFNTFISHYKGMYDLATLPLGVSFNVRNLPDECTGYEIVRCARRPQDIATITQGVVSTPVTSYFPPSTTKTKQNLYFPTGFLTTAMIAQGSTFKPLNQDYNMATSVKDDSIKSSLQEVQTNFGNRRVLQFVSPEFVYQPESMKSIILDKEFKLQQLRYLFGQRGDKNYSPYEEDGYAGEIHYLSPSISNLNLMTSQDSDKTISVAQPPFSISPFYNGWYYMYIDKNGKLSKSELKSDPYIIKMLTYYSFITFYKATPQSSSWSYIKQGSSYSDDNILSANAVYNIDSNVFAYIKLYEQADELCQKDNSRINTEIGDFADSGNTNTSRINHDTQTIDIKAIEVASSLKWNEVIKQVYKEKDSNETTAKKGHGMWWYEFAYKDHIDPVGQFQFCNAMFHGVDGAVLDRGGDFGDDGYTIGQDMVSGAGNEYKKPTQYCLGEKCWALRFVFGTGGRCGLIQVDPQITNKNRSLTAILGAKSYYKNNGSDTLESSTKLSLYKNVNINSILGTSLCNIRKTVSPYDGFTEKALNASVYYSTGNYFTETNKWNSIFGGDVYISILDYVSLHKASVVFTRDNDDAKYRNTNQYRTPSMMIGYAIPVESTINCMFSQGNEFCKDLKNENNSLVQVEPADYDNWYSQTEPQYIFNTAYVSENKSRAFASFDTDNIEDINKSVDYRCRYSNLKENRERIDSWTKFQSSDYLDVDTQYGQITNLRDYRQYLMFWQQSATGSFSVNERALTNGIDGTTIMLGSGGVLSRYDYFDTKAGMHTREYCDAQSDSTLYWYDHHNRELKGFAASGVISVSKATQAQNIFYKYADKDQSPLLFFDRKNNEVVAKVLSNGWSAAYSEVNKAVNSIYTIGYTGSIVFDNGVYLVNTNGNKIQIAQWDINNNVSTTWDGNLYTSLTYVVNKYPIQTKVFDNQEIVTPCDESIYCNSKEDYDAYFSSNHTYTWRTESMSTKSTLQGEITSREHNYKFAIPRDDEEELGYGSRMRGKYMLCTVRNNLPHTDVSLQYIITKFRSSWS